jgi:hypothetical protein
MFSQVLHVSLTVPSHRNVHTFTSKFRFINFSNKHIVEKIKKVLVEKPTVQSRTTVSLVRTILGTLGLLATGLLFVWLVLGWIGFTYSILDVFGMAGIRYPAGVAIGGLLLAAVSFNKF